MSRHADAIAPVRRSGPVTSWIARHAQACLAALGRLARQPFSSLMIILVIAVTLALPTALGLVVKNASVINSRFDNALDFSVFLRNDLSAADAVALAALIQQRADVDTVQVIDRDTALAEFRTQSGFGEALDALDHNPLPHTLVVRPSAANTSQSIEVLREELTSLPETDSVQIDTDWVQRLEAILDIVGRAIVIGSVLLGLAIVVIIGNTIRLDIQNRREEIEVTKLIGASNGFVRRPFLWTGFWYGLAGGLAALGIVQYGLYLLSEPISRLAGLYASDVAVVNLRLDEAAGIVGIGVALGFVGSWLAAARHMRRIEPR